MASFPGACVGVRVAWSGDASKAIVWFDPQLVESSGYSSQTSSPAGYPDEKADPNAKPSWFLVNTRSGKTEPLTLPEVKNATVQELGLGKEGEVIALLEEEIPEGTTGAVKSGNETFDLSAISEENPGAGARVPPRARAGRAHHREAGVASEVGVTIGPLLGRRR